MTRTLDQQSFNLRMQTAIQRQPLRKTIPLGHLEVINTGVVNINGQPIPMSKRAFSQLARILGVPLQFQGRVDKLFGEEATRNIVNRMKSALVSQGVSQVTVVASPTTKEIIGFSKRESDYITNSSFFEVAQEIIHDHDLLVRDFSTNNETGLVTISCFNPDANFQIGSHKDEFFQGGITLSNSLDDGLVVSPYMNRLVCLNGMIGESFSESYRLKSLMNEHMDGFRKHLQELSKRNYKPMQFEERVNKAMVTKASFAEIEAAANLIMGNSGAKEDEIGLWVPYAETKKEFDKFGLPTLRMTAEQKSNAKTGTTIWDMVNGLTHFSTHESRFKVHEDDRRLIQKEAGKMLSERFDMENVIVSPFQ
jgi:hypothetical protein